MDGFYGIMQHRCYSTHQPIFCINSAGHPIHKPHSPPFSLIQAGLLKTFSSIASIPFLVQFFQTMVHHSTFSLALAAIVFAFGATLSLAAPIGQAGDVHKRAVPATDQNLARDNRYQGITRRDDGEILARGGLFGAVTKCKDDDIFARGNRFGGITRRDDATEGAGDLFSRVERVWEDLPVA